MSEADISVKQVMQAWEDGRHAEVLAGLRVLFERASQGERRQGGPYFMTMFVWELLLADYAPARAALTQTRDGQVGLLLAGETIFGARDEKFPQERFEVIVSINDLLKDPRSTYGLFHQLLTQQPDLARRHASRALPAIVAMGDFSLAQQYLSDPLARLGSMNQLAQDFPILPPPGVAPRLSAELSGFMQDVVLRATVLRGLGRADEAHQLCQDVLSGLHNDALRALATRELATPGSIMKELNHYQAAREMPAYVYVWEFEVPAGKQADFLRCYGPHGDWARLFAKAEGYVGTQLLNDQSRPGRYLTIDRWTSQEEQQAFLAQYQAEYDALDAACAALTTHEASLGSYWDCQ